MSGGWRGGQGRLLVQEKPYTDIDTIHDVFNRTDALALLCPGEVTSL